MDDSEPDLAVERIQENVHLQETTPIQENAPVQENASVQASNDDSADFSFFKFASSKKKYNSQKAAETAGVAPATISGENTYDMSNERRGIALIFSNKNFESMPMRNGVEQDEKSLMHCFKEVLGFEDVRLYEDEYIVKIQEILKDASRKDHTRTDCFVCVFMSHGDENGIYGKGPKPLAIKQLTRYFKGNRCPTLVGKPKLFFIQACRGGSIDEGVSVTEVTDAGVVRFKKKKVLCRIPTTADFLMSYSTSEDYFAFLNKKKGSWFIQELTKELEKCDGHVEISTVLQRVTHQVAYEYQSNTDITDLNRKKQCPCFTSTLTKQLFFTPKIKAK